MFEYFEYSLVAQWSGGFAFKKSGLIIVAIFVLLPILDEPKAPYSMQVADHDLKYDLTPFHQP